jgi:iron complex outermembrane receptor protein
MRMGVWTSTGMLVASLFAASPLLAQVGITGRITARGTGAPIPGARVIVEPAAGTTAGEASSTESGVYQITVRAGTYSLLVTAIGFQPGRVTGVVVSSGMVTVDVVLGPLAIQLDPLISTPSRRQEKAIEAPASVGVISTVAIEERPALAVTDHLKALPGVDISQGGLVQSNVVGRGFNNIFSGALLTMTDNRFAAVPSLRVNVPAFFPGTNDDIERIEFVLGPGAALYGPNSANGVLSIITKSPLNSQGTNISLESGFRAGSRDAAGTSLDNSKGIFRVAGRHAGKVGDKFGYKVSGEYLTGQEWQSNDPAEPRTLDGRSCNAETGCRNFDINKWTAEARFDYRPSETSEIIGSFGRTNAIDLIEYTGIGAAQAHNWHYDYAQVRARFDRFFAQVFQNRSNSGNSDLSNPPEGSFLLRDGNPIVDNSRVTAFQVQHGFGLGERQDFIYGVDFAYTDARTQGTINGRNEADDEIKEIGAYLHSSTTLTDQLELVTAVRLDRHSRLGEPGNLVRLEDAVFSPRAALVFQPAEFHNFRVTYNRAFSTPSNNNLFLDIVAAQAGPYKVRALGVPEDGFNFRAGHCGAGGVDNLCMFPGPFPGVPTQAIPAQAALLWAVAAGAVAPSLPGGAGAILVAIPAPTTQVGTQLRRLDPTTRTFNDVSPSTVVDVGRMEPTITNAFEVGYKGILDGKFRLSVDVWYQKKENFVGPLIVESPNVFLDFASTLAYLQATLEPTLIANNVPAAQAAALTQGAATAMAGISGSSNPAALGVPLGTIVPDASLAASSDIFLTYRNFGNVDLWGGDIAVDYLIDAKWSVAGSYSVTSDDYFAAVDVGGPTDIALNASKSKGSLTVRYRDDMAGWSAEVRGRHVKGFPVNSGVYVSPVASGGGLKPLDDWDLVDAQITWRPKFDQRLLVSMVVENAFNANYATFVGVPQLGRLIMTKLQYRF